MQLVKDQIGEETRKRLVKDQIGEETRKRAKVQKDDRDRASSTTCPGCHTLRWGVSEVQGPVGCRFLAGQAGVVADNSNGCRKWLFCNR